MSTTSERDAYRYGYLCSFVEGVARFAADAKPDFGDDVRSQVRWKEFVAPSIARAVDQIRRWDEADDEADDKAKRGTTEASS